MGTAPDQTSIMCYQLPSDITKDGKPIVGAQILILLIMHLQGRSIQSKEGMQTQSLKTVTPMMTGRPATM
jgi:hypothetical protein